MLLHEYLQLLWPEGKLLNPSLSIAWLSGLQIVLFDNPKTGGSVLPATGLQRAIRSGRGLPVAFLRAPVMTNASP